MSFLIILIALAFPAMGLAIAISYWRTVRWARKNLGGGVEKESRTVIRDGGTCPAVKEDLRSLGRNLRNEQTAQNLTHLLTISPTWRKM